MPKMRIPPGKIYTTLVVGSVYAFKPEKIVAKTGSSICMKVMWTSRSTGMKVRPPQIVFFMKGTDYSIVSSLKLSLLRSYGEVKIHTVKVFPTRVLRDIVYADKDNNENIYLGVGMFLDQEEHREFPAFYIRGDYHMETPSYYRRKPEEWRTWCEFHMPFDFLENLKHMLISFLKDTESIPTQELEDLLLCIEFPSEKIEYLIRRIDKALDDGVIMPAVSYLIPINETYVLENSLDTFDIPILKQRRSCDEIIGELPKRIAKYETPEERQMAYLIERKERHGIAQLFEEPVIKDIVVRIKNIEGKLTVNYEPFGIDKVAVKPAIIDEGERGRPDFKLNLQSNRKKWIKFVEIKIKGQPHVKAQAWYFDQYVYEQLMAFCNKYEVSPEDVVIAFAYNPRVHNDYQEQKFYPNHWCYCILSLKEVQERVEKGKYTIYGEGYGLPM